MVSRTTLWEAILVIGAIVAGIGIRATNGDVVDHRYGNGLIVVGVLLAVVALAVPFLQSRSTLVTKEQPDAIRPVRKDTEAIQRAPIIAVEDERWINLFGRVLILEMKLRIANGSAPFQIVSYTFEGSGGSGAYPCEGAIGEQIRNEIFERQERLGSLIGMVNPNETVLRWAVSAFAPPNRGGTPGFVFTIHDAMGNEHRMVREPQVKLVVPITDATLESSHA